MRDNFKLKIIEPLLRHRPSTINEEDYLSIIFSTKSRVISSYYVKHGFKMPGNLMLFDAHPVQGAFPAERAAARNDYLTVRVDDRDPLTIHVEHHGKVFLLNKTQWKSIRKYLILSKGHEEI